LVQRHDVLGRIIEQQVDYSEETVVSIADWAKDILARGQVIKRRAIRV
jgi:hypothetical protein